MKVTLLAHTPQPEHILAAAARLCYSPATIDDVMESLTEEKTASFVEMLAEIGHESPIEHASFTFGIEGVSRSLLAQLTRHRIASFSVQSQRYVAETMFEYVVPPQIADIPEAADEFRRAMEEDQRHYESLTARLKEKHLADKLAAGMGEKEANRAAEKQAIEDARSLMNFFHHRCCNRAQWEIRELAERMLVLCLEVAPHLFKNAGPSCIAGPCPEGKMSCGRAEEVRAHYQQLKERT